MQHGYIIANIKGDYESRMRYYQTLETAQTKNYKKIFFYSSNRKESLERYLVLLVNKIHLLLISLGNVGMEF
jgi:hypothetical protein